MTTTPTIPAEQPAAARRVGTGTTATRVLGIAMLVTMGWLVAFGLGFSPADRDQEDAVRILYVHVPTAWVAYLAFAKFNEARQGRAEWAEVGVLGIVGAIVLIFASYLLTEAAGVI